MRQVARTADRQVFLIFAQYVPVVTVAALLPVLYGNRGGEHFNGQAWDVHCHFLLARDYPVIMTVNMYTGTLVAANLLADMLYLLIDPRLQAEI